MAKLKATIIRGKDGQPDRYFDRYGIELQDGDMIKYSEEDTEVHKLYRTTNGELVVDATNPAWIKSGRAVECEYGIYPLEYSEMANIVKA